MRADYMRLPRDGDMKLTIHAREEFGTSDALIEAIEAGAAVVKTVGSAVRAVQLAERYPHVLVIYRRVEPPDLKDLSQWRDHPEWPTPQLCASTQARYCALPRNLPNIAVEPALNEPKLTSAADALWLAQVEAERAKLLVAQGLRVVIGCFSTGEPTPELFAIFIREYLRAGGPTSALIGVHEYGHYKIKPGEDRHNLNRHRLLRAAAPECNALQWVVTETGLDRVTSEAYGLGRAFHETDWTEEQYADYLLAYAGALPDYVIGATVFTSRAESAMWEPFDVADALAFRRKVADAIRANPPARIVWPRFTIPLPTIQKERPMSYVVKAGDTLSRIAASFGLSLAGLLNLNPQITNPNLIEIGQLLRLVGEAIARPDLGKFAIAYDLSRHQELFDAVGRVLVPIDWDKLGADASDIRPDLLIVRAVSGVLVDPSFARSWAGAKRIGRPRSAYLNLRHDLAAMAQVDQLFRTVGDDIGELRMAIDIETKETPAWPYHTQASATKYAKVIDEARTLIFRRTGKTPLLYTGGWFWMPAFERNGIINNFDCPLWLAQYPYSRQLPALADLGTRFRPNVPLSWKTWHVWQFTDAHKAPGITANTVDVDLVRQDLVAELWR